MNYSMHITQKLTHIFIFAFVFIIYSFILPSQAHAAAGDITGARITTDGWYAEIDIEGFSTGGTADYGINEDSNPATIDNDPYAAKVVFTVTSQGYDANGTLGTITRTVYGTKTVRKPYPLQTTLDETASGGTLTIKVALSEFIYDDDKNGGAGTSGTDVKLSIPATWYKDNGSGGTNNFNNAVSNLTVTNNSTIHYPKVIGRWAWPSFETVTSDFLVEAVAFHKFAQYGKPIAAIAFAANDQSGTTVYATTTDMTVSTRTGDQNAVLVYAATMDIDALTQGQVVDVNFRAYPWVGDESSILDSRTTADGFAQPDERLGPLSVLNNKSGTYGSAYALVSRSGNDATGTVYASQSAAEAGSAYLTIGGAAAALKTYNNSNFSRNNAGGGTILLTEGDHPYPGTVPAADLGTSMDTWLTIKPASIAAKANTKISSGSTNAIKGLRVKLEGLTLSPSVTSGGGLSGRTTGDALWVHNNTINATSSAPFFAWKALYATNNSVTSLTNGFIANNGGTKGPFVLVRGNTASSQTKSHFYTVLGNKNITGNSFTESLSNPAGHIMSSNAIFAFNTVYNLDSAVLYAQTSTSTGIAIIQNLYERVGGDLTGTMELSSGNANGATTTNFLSWHNTLVGERQQWAYNSSGTASYPKLNWGSKFNILSEQGIKTDTFDATSGTPVPSGNRVGNWPIRYAVGNIGNKSMVRSFEGEFKGLFSQWGDPTPYLDVGFVSDKSKNSGSNVGNGNYTLYATSSAADVATTTSNFYQVLPYDLLGNPRYGSPDSGPYEYQPPYTMGVNQISTSTTIRVYGDEKWKINAATSSSGTANLSVTLPGSDTSQWLDIFVSDWQNTGTRQKLWTETSSTTGLTNTVHTVGDLTPNTYYAVAVDSVTGSNISGASCTAGVCLSNGSGQITFTYTGGYSTHSFSVVESSDTTAPSVSVTAPTDGSTVSGTVSLTASASDGVGVSGVQFKLDSTTLIGSEDTTDPYSASWDSTAVSNGSHTLSAVARDAAGNMATSTITITVSNSSSSSGSSSSNTTSLAAGNGPIVPNGFSFSFTRDNSVTPNSNASTTTSTSNTGTPNTTQPQQPSQTTPVTKKTFTLAMSVGSKNNQVLLLQQTLNARTETQLAQTGAGSPGNETNYFGPITRKAVEKFQLFHSIVPQTDPGFGFVGPKTRAVLNSLE